MTSYGPTPLQLSLYERLIGASLVVVARIKGVVEEWTDPDDDDRRFRLVELKVKRTLAGEAEKRILVRISGEVGKEGIEWTAPVEEDAEALFLLAPDEEGERPRYGLQHGSAFPLRDDTLELPGDLLLGDYAEDPDKVGLEIVTRMLEDIAAAEAERNKHYEQIGGPDWQEAEYPRVEEMGAAAEEEDEDKPSGPPGPKPGWPNEGGRAASKRRRSD